MAGGEESTEERVKQEQRRRERSFEVSLAVLYDLAAIDSVVDEKGSVIYLNEGVRVAGCHAGGHFKAGVSKLFTYRKKFEGLGHSRRHAPLPWSGPLTVRLNRVAQGGGRGGVLRDS
ncbi:unnamed protein product [Pleuronectes platessa]|uniref:Uncharacterized protein n=1 Tax=Pleuronectes platessa TaxID=8262 RepID=A0A9N7Z8N7_PLEPL|nr:unnamed protein product [Pleuronectes platessa]